MNTAHTDFHNTHNENGSEKVDTTPVAISIPFERPEPLHIRNRRIILQYLAEQAANNPETMEEMDDFDCGEEDFQYAFEEHFDHMERLYLAEKERREALAREQSASSDGVSGGEGVQPSDSGHDNNLRNEN